MGQPFGQHYCSGLLHLRTQANVFATELRPPLSHYYSLLCDKIPAYYVFSIWIIGAVHFFALRITCKPVLYLNGYKMYLNRYKMYLYRYIARLSRNIRNNIPTPYKINNNILTIDDIFHLTKQ